MFTNYLASGHQLDRFSVWTFAIMNFHALDVWTFICYGKCSQFCATSTHLVSTKREVIWRACATLFANCHVRIKESSALPPAIDESFPSITRIQNNIVQKSFNIAHTFNDHLSCFSRQLTRCTSTVRLGTSYLAQKQTKTRPTSASTTPPRVKPLYIHIMSHLLCSF